jgi:uncharacterized membrane protein required for colicin V production
MIISIIVIMVLIASFFGGLKEGAVKNFFGLVGLLIAIALGGLYYELIAGFLAFLPGENWENFFGFYIALTILVVILHLVFLVPRRIIQKIWGKGILYRLIGGILGVLYGAAAMVLFTLVLFAYPIFDFLERWLAGSSVLAWLVDNLSFVQAMLPDVFEKAARSFAVFIGPLY